MLQAESPYRGLHEVSDHGTRVFLKMTYHVTNSPNCMSGLKTDSVFLRSFILNNVT